ncbi:hypothetical protein LCM10_15110 [Rossellomorea aquimaris]|uniref:hypothetical protein n=1 Tax=Rossellomorea aquimaris TaxID=189382 RepID=UPI001CD44530|nr:hypothetical protein [Rossellomorea aquimaris]MCA1056328.1 hypothetical protein [Rossellomorea aquimaris]
MTQYLIAAAAFVFLLPILALIPMKMSFKHRIILAFLSFLVAILALASTEFLPVSSVLIILLLIVGLISYFVESRVSPVMPVSTVLQPEKDPPAALHHPIDKNELPFEQDDHETVAVDDPEIGLMTESEDDHVEVGQNDYIEELDLVDEQGIISNEEESLAVRDPEGYRGEVEIPVLEAHIEDSESSTIQDEEEEYNRLFAGRNELK